MRLLCVLNAWLDTFKVLTARAVVLAAQLDSSLHKDNPSAKSVARDSTLPTSLQLHDWPVLKTPLQLATTLTACAIRALPG